MSDSTGQCPKFLDNVQLEVSARRLFTVLTIFFLPGVQLIQFFFCYVRNFEGIIYILLVGVFISFLKGFGSGV
jgi:hypothetical protein